MENDDELDFSKYLTVSGFLSHRSKSDSNESSFEIEHILAHECQEDELPNEVSRSWNTKGAQTFCFGAPDHYVLQGNKLNLESYEFGFMIFDWVNSTDGPTWAYESEIYDFTSNVIVNVAIFDGYFDYKNVDQPISENYHTTLSFYLSKYSYMITRLLMIETL